LSHFNQADINFSDQNTTHYVSVKCQFCHCP